MIDGRLTGEEVHRGVTDGSPVLRPLQAGLKMTLHHHRSPPRHGLTGPVHNHPLPGRLSGVRAHASHVSGRL